MKKIISVTLAVIMVLATFAVTPVFAETQTLQADTSWGAGSDGVYRIYDAGDWLQFVELSNSGNAFSGKTITLENDITLYEGDASTWETNAPGEPLKGIKGFDGIFDGQGHSISGMYQNGNSNGSGRCGLFVSMTWSDGKMKVSNFTLQNSYMEGTTVGAVVGRCHQGTIENIYVAETVTLKGTTAIGGIVGEQADSDVLNIKSCVFAGTLIADNNGSWSGRGGIIGNSYKTTNISDCMVTGKLRWVGNTQNYGAKIIGRNDKTSSISNTVYAGTLTIESTGSNSYNSDIVHNEGSGDSCALNSVYSVVSSTSPQSTHITEFQLVSEITPGANWTKRDFDYPVPTGVAEMMKDVQLYKPATLLDGAAVRLVGNGTNADDSAKGIRFTAELSKAYLGTYQGTGTVTYGMIVALTDDVESVSDFTHAALAGKQYREINSADAGFKKEETADAITYHGALVGLGSSNNGTAFSARAYVAVTVDGVTTYYYSAYDADVNSRTLSYVASQALQDATANYSDDQKSVLQSYIVE